MAERSDVACPECGEMMKLRPGRFGPYYRCPRFPACSGSHGAHPDGEPMGIPANAATKRARIEAHASFDAFWRRAGMRRRQAYNWLAQVMEMDPDSAHIGRFNEAQCQKVIAACAERARHPQRTHGERQ